MKTISTLKHIADMPVPAFDALAALNIYHFADLAWPTVRTPHLRHRALATCHLHGILHDINDPEDGHAIQRRYNEAIEAHAANTLPGDWKPTFDYWGARCFSNDTHWESPKTGTAFAGDTEFRYETFADAEALASTTRDFLTALQQAEQLECA